ncbi:Antibiotic biosynthesis monooxygenase [Fontimonas thermophila]|uniref:Antibiotic biosynthesis monooxygenase n=1 Tax=Fontimonas thermophila TaxID=1076937 RepID=A0A1I2HWE8_9GAMM|nr:antibiotic biosynthesis monooxygenase [Fontimonas thermophila]SFF34142.1 Antibiotic biosynthesis monooxygenase [Fontimonas thermophila]
MSTTTRTGFAVVYQWRLKPGMEEQFRQAWEELTAILLATRGARGSRLHRTDNGHFVAYAQWPDQQTWERSCALHELDEKLSRRMLEAVEETWSPMLLTTVSDCLIPEHARHDRPDDTTH